ncbi:MAG: hypothetical protein EOM66_02790 [Clostridia bacterium]|nr:hypothetical protein [Candidatus Pelethousia sp.]NCB30315.1 hypothetical protein [Clostridia bacterium]
MTISPRRRRKRIRIYTLAGAALLCILAGLLFYFFKREQALQAVSVPLPQPTATATPMATVTPTATITPTAVPSPSAVPQTSPVSTVAPAASPAPVRSPFPTLPIRKSVLERSLYQGSLSIVDDQARGKLSLTYVNNGVETLYAIYLHLYPNAMVPGSLSIKAAALDGVQAYYTLDGAMLCLPLINELRSGESARIYLEFTVQFPEGGFGATSSEGTELSLLGIFPTAAVYENGWISDTTPEQVDFAPLADWRVVIAAAQAPTFSGGEVEQLGDGRYLCTARAAVPELLFS